MDRLHLSFVIVSVVIALSNVDLVFGEKLSANYKIKELNRTSFPPGFLFGTASSSYQVEGAWKEDGKGPSMWDNMVHQNPEIIKDRSNGDTATDSYHLYKWDVKLMKNMNSDAYRFSISWPRILPRGKLSTGVNEKGIEYYNKLIDELQARGIQPFVTIFHWDIPQALEEEYGGFLSPQIINDFRDYANLCFQRFGDRVKFWSTFNEIWTFCSNKYGNSGTEPYTVAHHMLLSHAETVKLYRQKYQPIQKGKTGIVHISHWYEPLTNTSEDRGAAKRQHDFQFGWLMQPLASGKYPNTMRRLVGDRLPKFTKEQSQSIKGSIDFLGINYYSAEYIADNTSTPSNSSFSTDPHTTHLYARNGILIGAETASEWLHVYPSGIYKLLKLVKRKYNNPIIYITENGISESNNSSLSLKEALQDGHRIQYYHDHLAFLLKAITDGVNVKGFFAWALMDNFEWTDGYTVRFGIHYVDYNNNCKRYTKLSGKWFMKFLKRKNGVQ